MVWGWRLLHRAGHHVHSQNVCFWHTRHYLRKMLPLFVRWGEKRGPEPADGGGGGGGTWVSMKIKPKAPPFVALVLSPHVRPPHPLPRPPLKWKNKKAFCPLGGIKRQLCFSKGAFKETGFYREKKNLPVRWPLANLLTLQDKEQSWVC